MAKHRQQFLAHLELVERIVEFTCRRQGFHGEDVSDFSAHVKLKLVEDDYAVFRKFRGKCSLKTYLATVINHLFLDYRNALWGKWRPSAEARRLGGGAVRLEQLMFRDGLGFHQAVETLKSQGHGNRTESEWSHLAGRLPVRYPRRMEGEAGLRDLPAAAADGETQLLKREAEKENQRVGQIIQELLQQIPSEDRLILKMRFQDDFKIVDIARVLRVNPKRLYKRIDKNLRNLRASLARQGITVRENQFLDYYFLP